MIEEISDFYKKKALDMLTELLKFNSVLDEYSPNTDHPFGEGARDALNYFLKCAEDDGFLVYNADNYAGHIEMGSGDEILGILGHLDVVPADGDWNTNPFEATIKDGRLYARGSVDDKGPMVSAYIAMKILKDMGVKPNKRIRLILGCDEETESRCLKHYFTKCEIPTLGFSPDAEYPLIYGEKAFNNFKLSGRCDEIISWVSGQRINIVPDKTTVVLKDDYSKEFIEFIKRNGYKGEISGNSYTVYGKASHGSIPENGINSNFIMAEFISGVMESRLCEMILDLFAWDYSGKKLGIDMECGDMGCLSINPGIVRVADGMAFIEVDCRCPSDDNNIDMIVSAKVQKYGFSYEAMKKVPVHYVDPNSFLVKTLASVYERVSGDKVNKPMTIGGGTYAKMFPNCVAFGPQYPWDEEVIHSPNEYMIIDDFYKNIAIYLNAIYELVMR